MPEPSRMSLNTATVSKQWTLAQCVDGCPRHGIGGISPWRDKLHEAGVKEGARLIRDAGLAVSGLCRGGWYTAEGSLTQAVIDDNRRAVDEAAEIGAACLVMVVGGLTPGLEGHRGRPGAGPRWSGRNAGLRARRRRCRRHRAAAPDVRRRPRLGELDAPRPRSLRRAG